MAKLFGQIVRTLVNVAALPIEAMKDVVTLGGVGTDRKHPYTVERLRKLKEEAEES